jgi:hypothetical protein
VNAHAACSPQLVPKSISLTIDVMDLRLSVSFREANAIIAIAASEIIPAGLKIAVHAIYCANKYCPSLE